MIHFVSKSDSKFDHRRLNGLSPLISEKSAPIGLVSIIKVIKETKIRHIWFNIFSLSGRFRPHEFVHPHFDLEDPPQ